jgi:cytochrome c
MLKPYLNISLIIPLLTAASNAAGGDAEHGQSLYQSKCTACHSIEYNGVGPAHKGVYGRKAGSAADYAYSEALKRSDVVWNDKTLNKWLTNPEKLIPGQKMGFSVPNPKERADLIAYLKQTGRP